MTILFRFLPYLYNKFFNYKEFKLSFLWVFLAKIQNLNIPENTSSLWNFSYGALILSFIALISFINLFITILILQFNTKFELEIKFKNYPFILKLINYYKTASFINILIEGLFVFITILIIFIFSLLMVLKIINDNS